MRRPPQAPNATGYPEQHNGMGGAQALMQDTVRRHSTSLRSSTPHHALGNGRRVLLVDLNNFSRYPTIAIGYLAAGLRSAGYQVDVVSPLAHGVSGFVREPEESRLRALGRQLNYRLAQSPGWAASSARKIIARARNRHRVRDRHRIVDLVASSGPASYDLVMVSTYLVYHEVCCAIGQLCQTSGTPLLIGGSYFSNPEVAHSWLDIPGLTALVGGEVECEIAEVAAATISGDELSRHPGLWLPDRRGKTRVPLQDLDAAPFPDYSDFPWERYPNRIVPIITGRGCGWGACTFCSDVTSTSGRTFRTRSAENVLAEMEYQAGRFETSLFAFTDLKLNSDLSVWDSLITRIPSRLGDARWIGSVHVGSDEPNGLTAAELRHARRAGAVRLTTGLESGSQRVLDRWAKGTDLGTTSRFIEAASSAGISLRVTMIHGSPEETAEDVIASAEYLERHSNAIDRVHLNRFQIMIGPSFLRRYEQRPSRFPSIRITERNPTQATAEHVHARANDRAFRKATRRLLEVVHRINRRPLSRVAVAFEGVM